jgi:hypothetical protein
MNNVFSSVIFIEWVGTVGTPHNSHSWKNEPRCSRIPSWTSLISKPAFGPCVSSIDLTSVQPVSVISTLILSLYVLNLPAEVLWELLPPEDFTYEPQCGCTILCPFFWVLPVSCWGVSWYRQQILSHKFFPTCYIIIVHIHSTQHAIV